MSRGSDVTIRAARPEDLAAVADVFLACWRESYADFLPAHVIGLYDEVGARAIWRPSLVGPAADISVLVAEGADGSVVGVVRIGRDPGEPGAGHVYSLYVDPEAQGRGVGARLLAAADDRFGFDGLREVTLWVFAANVAARRFYAREGWRPDGGERVEPAYGEPELRLRRPVRTARSRDGEAKAGPW